MKFIIKLSSEITIKSKPVRKQFTQRLYTNIKKVLRHRDLVADVIKRWDMLEVLVVKNQGQTQTEYLEKGQRVIDALCDIPGIAHFFVVEESELAVLAPDYIGSAEDALSDVAEKTWQVYGERICNKSFVVRCKRSGVHSFSSHDAERLIGASFFSRAENCSVKMRNPDITVSLEIKGERLFIIKQRYKGLGGYPVGCVGPVLSLISGGYDSCVASYDVIRRGMDTHYCFFNLGGRAHEAGVMQVAHYLWDRYSASQRTGFVSVPFEGVVEEILKKISNPYMGVVLKRMMLRAAAQVAEDMEIAALVTGECIAQVSSQTLANLAVIEKASDCLVLRPLISADKTDIIATAAKIGVAKYAEKIPEYCAVISDKPTTSAKMHRVLQEEQQFDFAVLEQAIASRKICATDKVYENSVVFDEVAQQAVPSPDQVVIDIRRDDEREKSPLILHGNQTLNIPSYKINQAFTELNAEKQYLLYCDRGVMSKVHTAHLVAEGYANVKVYRPE